MITAVGVALALEVAGPHCRAAQPVMAKAGCAETRLGVVLAASPERAAKLLAHAADGEARFRLHFGRDPPKWLFIEQDGEVGLTPKQESALALKGFAARKARLSPNAKKLLAKPAATEAGRQIAQLEGLAGDKAERRAAKIKGEVLRKLVEGQESGIVPHELGHAWFGAAFWPVAPTEPAGQKRYGTPAPD